MITVLHSIAKVTMDPTALLTGGHLQMKPCGVLLATAHVPPFLQGLPLQPSNTLSQRWPGEQKQNVHVTICTLFRHFTQAYCNRDACC